jgi:hypothetical protein
MFIAKDELNTICFHHFVLLASCLYEQNRYGLRHSGTKIREMISTNSMPKQNNIEYENRYQQGRATFNERTVTKPNNKGRLAKSRW